MSRADHLTVFNGAPRKSTAVVCADVLYRKVFAVNVKDGNDCSIDFRLREITGR
jgi:hypothetical protein